MKKRKLRKKVKLEQDEDLSRSWRCVICSTEEEKTFFYTDNDLVFHHMTHSILELAQALTDIQKMLSSTQIFDVWKNRTHQHGDDSNVKDDILDVVEILEEEDIIEKSKEEKIDLKKHECHICGKIISSRGNLNKHLAIHDPDKKFPCKLCDLKFNQQRDLNTHSMQIHTGERPHICKICGKGFVHKHYLSEHMDYHTGERKYQCPQCGKCFQSTSTLVKHSERHKGQRDHQCDQCSKSFFVHVDLRSHVRLVHEKAGNTGIPIFAANQDTNPEEIPTNYAPIEQPKVRPPEAAAAGEFPVYDKPQPVLRMTWPQDDEKRRKEIESQQIDEWMIAQGASFGTAASAAAASAIRVPPLQLDVETAKVAANAESLTLTNMENHSQTMIVLPASAAAASRSNTSSKL
jgi:hypothetical protein